MRKPTMNTIIALLTAVVVGCGGGADSDSTVTVKTDRKQTGDQTTNGGSETDDVVAEGFGTLHGVVKLSGNPPDLNPLVRAGDATAKDAAVCAAVAVPDQSIVTGAGGTLQNVFVYLPRAPKGAKSLEPPSEPFYFDQKNCMFIPHASDIRVGREMKILNSDMVLHNTHLFPKKPANPPFNNGIKYTEDKADGVPYTYQDAEREPIQIKCDIHPWMIAYQLPIDHPFSAVTDENGEFTITDLPAGKHDFIVWHEKPRYIERKYTVTIKPDETTDVTITVGADALTADTDAPPLKTIVLNMSR